jgi:hypothetical protein
MRHLIAPALLALAAALPAADSITPEQLEEIRVRQAELDLRLGAMERAAAKPAGGHGHHGVSVETSVTFMAAVGASTADDEHLGEIKAGGHDPKRNGFTFQGAEISLSGEVDGIAAGEVHLVALREEPEGEALIELEEAFIRSTGLGAFEVKAGYYLLEFGRFNTQHGHDAVFLDQGVINGRIFGGDGQRTPGARIAYTLPTAWTSTVLVGAMNADGEHTPSFRGSAGGHHHGDDEDHEESAVGGRDLVEDPNHRVEPMWHGRWINGFSAAGAAWELGASLASGPNAAGEDTRSLLWGVDGEARWTLGQGGFLLGQLEYINRRYEVPEAELGENGADGTLPEDTLIDQGVTALVEWGFTRGWSVGLRGDYAWSDGDNLHHEDADSDGIEEVVVESAEDDPGRADRWRISGLVAWRPAESVRLRVQYDLDDADFLEDKEHSIFLGVDVTIGAHTH